MNIKNVALLALSIIALSQSVFAENKIEAKNDDAKMIMLVVENNKKELPKGVDPLLASTIGGLNAVQKTVKNAGNIDHGCKGGSYISYEPGNGEGSVGGNMQWKAYTVRLGKYIKDNLRMDFVYVNEGHPTNNHRDGFALEAAYDIPVTKNFALEVGAGLDFSMNTTIIDGESRDDKRLGLVGTVAAIYYLDRISPGLHLRAEYNHVEMPGAMSTDSVMIGVGKVFGSSKDSAKTDDGKTEISLMGETYKTNHPIHGAPHGYQIEAKEEISTHAALSLSYLHEGKDALVDRQGVATQLWYVQPITNKTTISVGAGPYFADNKLDNTNGIVNALVSIDAKRNITEDTSISLRFSRIVDFSGDNDRDIFGVAISTKF
ncbi:MAG: hypothetical protein PHY93_16230 [Bacteriovorax sp.]|nr:hypothetical protein [Bacteriovorax sp.]